MDQMIGKAITAVTITGLMQQHRLEWQGFDPANQTWAELKTHFGEGYGQLLLTGTGIPALVGGANNAVEDDTVDAEDLHDDDASTINSVLGSLQAASTAAQQETNDRIEQLTQQANALLVASQAARVERANFAGAPWTPPPMAAVPPMQFHAQQAA